MAQMTLSGSVKSDISVTASHQFDLVTGTVPLRNAQTGTVSSAATSVTCDLIWQSSGTIAGGGAAVDIDLNDAVACSGIMEYWGEDDTSRNAQFDRVHGLYIRNTTTGAAAGASVLTVGADVGAPFPWFFGTAATDTIEISPGGFVTTWCGVDAGWSVGAGASDVLQIANNDAVNAMTYEIIVIGESQQSASTTTTSTSTTSTTSTTAAPTTTTT